MPFNLSGPILIYDRDAFREAGLDADRAPRTLDEVKAAAEALVRRDAQGNVTRYGIALQISPWLFEQMLAKQNALYVNNGNGREGRATEAVFDSEAGVRILAWWQEMVDSGLAYNAGTADLNALLKLASGEASMAIGSTAILGGAAALLSIAGGAGDRFGSGPLPAPEGDGGIVVGGGALWIMERRPEEEQRGAWEFIKFASRPEQQAQWHADTGYFPTRLSANDLPPAVQRREQFPQFTTAMDQLHASPDTVATRGALVGRFDAVRDRITRAFEQVLSGGADPAQELQAAADDATEIIEEYNKTAPD
jgi:sn-glycerol 3-phosphate transport system substrate-binding protein